MKNFIDGIKKSIPIFVGYFAVSFTFGVYCFNNGIAPLTSIIISLTNLSSAGQFAGAQLMTKLASIFEIGLVVFVINLRYILMSLSLSQKLDKDVKLYEKLIFGFAITDEIYALAIKEEKKIDAKFMFGLMILPILGWTLGTAFGVLSSSLLPESISQAFNIALYGMFISAIMPDTRKSISVLITVLLSVFLSCVYYAPYLSENVSVGFKVIIVTIVVCSIVSLMFPIKDEEEEVK